MKQGINLILPVEIEYDLNQVSSIEFMFNQEQTGTRLTFTYPSVNASRKDDSNIILLSWTREQTYKFDPAYHIEMDTRINLLNSLENPETKMVSLQMKRTLFEE